MKYQQFGKPMQTVNFLS